MSELTPSLPPMPGDYNCRVEFCVIITSSASGSTITVIAASLGVIVVISIALVITITGAIVCLRNRRIIEWCDMRRRRPSSHATATTDHDKEQVTELATVIYDTPNVIKEHTITTQENVAYGGTIPLKENVAYGGTIPLTQVTELATVIYDTPNVIKEYTITTQENVAYGGTIPLQHNEAYQQVYIN